MLGFVAQLKMFKHDVRSFKKICLIKAACRSSEVSIINTDVEVKTLSVIGYALMTTSIISHR